MERALILKQLQHHSLTILLIAIILLGGFLRLGYVGVNSYASDEARVSLLALQMTQNGDLITSGITSSAGARNLPASIYAFLPPYWLSTDPLIATLYVGVLSTLAVIGMAWFIRRVFDAQTSLISTLFFATAPFAIFFSRNIWTQNLLIPLSTLWLFATYYAITQPRYSRNRGVAIFISTLISGITFQVHLAGIGLLLAWGIMAIWDKWRDAWQYALGAIILSFLILSPFIHHAWCCAPEYIFEYTNAVDGHRIVSSRALEFSAQVALNTEWDYLAMGDLGTIGNSQLLAGLVGFWIILGALGWLRAWRRIKREQRVLLVLSGVLGISTILSFTSYSFTSPVRLHYMLAILPITAVILAGANFVFKQAWWRYSIMIFSLLIGGIWAYQSLFSLSTIQGQVAPNGMGTTLESVRDIAKEIPTDLPIIIHTQSNDELRRGEPATWRTLLWDANPRIVRGWTTLFIPNEPTTIMTDVNGMPAWEEWQAFDIPSTSIQPIIGSPPTFISQYTPDDFDTLPDVYQQFETPIQFDSGLQLRGWRMHEISGRLRVVTVYRVMFIPDTSLTIQQFTHLRYPNNPEFDPDLMTDIPLDVNNWRVGDTLIGIADFILPDDASRNVTIDTGQYDLRSGNRFVHEQGGDTIRLNEQTVSKPTKSESSGIRPTNALFSPE